MSKNEPRVALAAAIEACGGRKQLAEFLGVSVEAIMNLQRQNRKYLPGRRAFQVSVERPDLVELSSEE